MNNMFIERAANAAAAIVNAQNEVTKVINPDKGEVDWSRVLEAKGFSPDLAVVPDEIEKIITGISTAKCEVVKALQPLGMAYDADWDVITYDGVSYRWKPLEEAEAAKDMKPRLLKGGKPVERTGGEAISFGDSFMDSVKAVADECPYTLSGSLKDLFSYLHKQIAEKNGGRVVRVHSETGDYEYDEVVITEKNGFNRHYSFFLADEGQSYSGTVEELEHSTNEVNILKAFKSYSDAFWMKPERLDYLVESGRLTISDEGHAGLSLKEMKERFRFTHTCGEIRKLLNANRGESIVDRETLGVDREYKLLCALQGTDESRNKDAEEKAKVLAMRTEGEINLTKIAGYVMYLVAAEAGKALGERTDYSSENIHTFMDGLRWAGNSGAFQYLVDTVRELVGEGRGDDKPIYDYKLGQKKEKKLGAWYYNSKGELSQLSLWGNVGGFMVDCLYDGVLTMDEYVQMVKGWHFQQKEIANRAQYLAYRKGCGLMQKHEYEFAKKVFASLAGYRDADEQYNRCIEGLKAQAKIAEGDYQEALNYLKPISKTLGFEDLIAECREHGAK